MTITVQSIVKRAQIALNDIDGVRSPASDLVDYLNQGQRDIVTARPDITATIGTLALEAGDMQTIPANAAALIDIQSNAGGTKKRITKTDMVLLDAVDPAWRSKTGQTEIVHFMHDLRTPRVFYVYPPAAVGAAVRAEYSAYPIDAGVPNGDGTAWTTAYGDIGIPDQYATALEMMVMHYAYAKDLEGAGNAALSMAYLARAEQILGVQLTSSATVAPRT
jgi:hypothetical protein